MGYVRTTPKILRIFEQHPNKILTRESIARLTGLSESQVRSAMRGIIANNNLSVTVIENGYAWRYDGNVVSESEPAVDLQSTFETIGRTKDGSLLLRDSDGNIWRAERI